VQRIINALWTLHTHVYEEFEATPRLLPISPVSGYGKSKVLKLHKELASETHLTKNTTAPAMYRQLEHRPRTICSMKPRIKAYLLTA
jgi:hypothetical protein